MGHAQWWKTLEHLIVELRKRQVAIPTEVMTHLRSAKTMISVYNVDPSHLETLPTIENYLMNVESTLVNAARERFGQAFANRWIERIESARREEERKAEPAAPHFVPRLPKGKHWIRVLPSDDILKESMEQLAQEIGLSCEMQRDGYILVYGKEEQVKDFVSKMAKKCRRTRKN